MVFVWGNANGFRLRAGRTDPKIVIDDVNANALNTDRLAICLIR